MNLNGKKLAEYCALKCLEKKAENVVILDLQGRSSVADYFVICSGYSDRQVASIAEHVADEIKKIGQTAGSKEGLADGRWALLDFSDVIVHVFQDQLRDYYSLESLWLDAVRIRVSEAGSETSKVKIQSYGSSGHQGHSLF